MPPQCPVFTPDFGDFGFIEAPLKEVKQFVKNMPNRI